MMAQTKASDPGTLNKALDLFQKAKEDEKSVTQVEQPLQIHIVGTQAYIPSYTRSVMDKNFGAPVMAIQTRTETESKTVFIYPAKNANARGAKMLRNSETMGAAYVAFGVPLKKVGVKLHHTRRVILPLYTLEVPGEGIVYWASFGDMEKERRDIDLEATASAKQAKARKAPAAPTPTETSN